MLENVGNHRGKLFFAAGLAAALSLGWAGLPHVLYDEVPQPLAFAHAQHGPDAGLACEDCHALRDDGTFSGVPSTRKCADCHAAAMGESEAERRLVGEYVAAEREVPWLVYARQPDNVYFPHAPHLALAGLACERCHGPHGASTALRPFERNRLSGYSRDIWGPALARIGRERWQGMKMTDCVACHREAAVSDSCLDCHK